MTAVPDTIKLAMQLMNSGQLRQAEYLCHQVLHISGNHPDALHMIGLIHHRMGNSHDAITFISKAIENNPRIAEYYYNLGYIFAASGELENAIKAYKVSISLKPNYAEAINNLGLILYNKDKIDESIILFKKAIGIKPDFTNAYYNLGNAMQSLGIPKAAIAAYDQVLKILPNSAQTRFNRSLSLLLTENFEEGWVEYEWRFRNLEGKKIDWNENGTLRWDGISFSGKRLLVLDEQGIGDTLQFIRYLSLVKELGGTVAFETIQPLMGLLSDFYGIDELLDRGAVQEYNPEFDLYAPLMSLPGIFNTRLETIPAKVPYILPDAAKVQNWRRRIKKDLCNIGIVWAGKPTNLYNNVETSGLEHADLKWAGTPASKIADSRSNSLEHFAPLAEVPGIRLYGLQKGEAACQAGELSHLINVINLDERLNDFADTAAVIANLDLVISVDTSVAHLAGAMGKPVWVLIPFVADWRWMLGREDSPWYPSMRLFRQSKKGEWHEVFQRIVGELHALVHQEAMKPLPRPFPGNL